MKILLNYLLLSSILFTQSTNVLSNATETYLNKESNQNRTITWTKGVTPPSMKNNDFKRYDSPNYIEYIAPFKSNSGYYDVNKTPEQNIDRTMCYAAAASNAIHWFLDINKDYINRFILENPTFNKKDLLNTYIDSFIDQNNSAIYKKYLELYGFDPDGYYSDLLIDNFINGFKVDQNNVGTNYSPAKKEYLLTNGPDKNFGFFFDIFKDNIITTRRSYYGSFDSLSRDLIKLINDGNFVLLDYIANGIKHVVTVYGVEYDENNLLKAIYITDSDDDKSINQGIYRLNVYKDNRNCARVTSSKQIMGGTVEYLQILNNGQTYFENYFNKDNFYTINYLKDNESNEILYTEQVDLNKIHNLYPYELLNINKVGYNFTNWKAKEDNRTFIDKQEVYNLVEKTQTINLYPEYQIQQFNITYDCNFNNSIDKIYIDSYKYNETKYFINNPYNEQGYLFLGWLLNNNLYQPGDKIPLNNENITIYPKYELLLEEIITAPTIICKDLTIYEGDPFNPLEGVYVLDNNIKINLSNENIVFNNFKNEVGKYKIIYEYINKNNIRVNKTRNIEVLKKEETPLPPIENNDDSNTNNKTLSITFAIVGTICSLLISTVLFIFAYKKIKK